MLVKNNIHLLRIDFEIKISSTKSVPRFVNVLLLLGDKITLVDTGVKGSETQIFNYIINQGRRIEDIATVILSHAHPDHIGSASKIKERTNCEIIAHPLEKEWIENIHLQYQHRPVPAFYSLADSSVKVDRLIENNETLQLQENQALFFTKSPGHSKGMLNILFKEEKILFTADAVPLKNDLPIYEDYFELLKSLEEIKRNDEYEIMLTSWTPPVTGRQAINQLIQEGAAYMQRINKIISKMYTGKASEDLENCKNVLAALGFPPFFAMPIIHKAFMSHLQL